MPTCHACKRECLPRHHLCPECRARRTAEANARQRQREREGAAAERAEGETVIGRYRLPAKLLRCLGCGEAHWTDAGHRFCRTCRRRREMGDYAPPENRIGRGYAGKARVWQ